MRKLKFRVYVKNLDLTCEVDRINFDTQEVIFNYQTLLTVSEEYTFKFDEVELMQFIGIKDKYNREIFEGDIIKLDSPIDDNATFEVKYEPILAMFLGAPYKSSGKAFEFSMMKPGIIPRDFQIDIIGCIYNQ